jgi:hypothetical protein
MGNTIGEAIGCLVWIAGIAAALLLALAVYFLVKVNDPVQVRSSYPLQPTFELQLNNNQVDTIYVYTEPEK